MHATPNDGETRGNMIQARAVRLSELRPEFGATGIPGRFFLTFDCPTTPKGRVYVQFHRAPKEAGGDRKSVV
jgi:hypothetical protein